MPGIELPRTGGKGWDRRASAARACCDGPDCSLQAGSGAPTCCGHRSCSEQAGLSGVGLVSVAEVLVGQGGRSAAASNTSILFFPSFVLHDDDDDDDDDVQVHVSVMCTKKKSREREEKSIYKTKMIRMMISLSRTLSFFPSLSLSFFRRINANI